MSVLSTERPGSALDVRHGDHGIQNIEFRSWGLIGKKDKLAAKNSYRFNNGGRRDLPKTEECGRQYPCLQEVV